MTNPAFIASTYAGVALHTAGNSFIVPAGVLVKKTYAANPVFEAQNDTVTVQVVNQGKIPLFNVTVNGQPDGFDRAFAGTLHQTYATLSPNSAQSFNFTVEIFTSGNHTTSTTSVAFTLGGSVWSYTFPSSNLLVYKLLQATATTVPPTPVEGSNFLLTVNVVNPTPVDVSNVSISIPIPQGLTIVNASSGFEIKGHTITLTLPSLAGGASASRSVTLRAGTDGSITLKSGTLTFQYQGTTIRGFVTTPAIVVGIDLLIRYELPIGLAAILTIIIAVYMHRKLTYTQPK
jgi:hypothetical protein